MTTVTRQATHAYAALLTRYVVGDLEEQTFDALCSTLDDSVATSDERLALAGFYLDALAAGDTAHALPRADEIADVLTIARA